MNIGKILRNRQNTVELPPDNDFDVVVAGVAVEDHYDCQPQEGLANPDCRTAAKIAVAALREMGQLGDSIGTFTPANWPDLLRGPWHFDIPDGDPNVTIIADALRNARDTWSEPHEEFGRVAVAALMRNQRLPLSATS